MALNIVLITFGVFVLQLLKPILVIILTPCLFFWGILHLTKSIQSLFGRVIVRFFFIVVILGVSYFFDQSMVDSSSKYKIENLSKTIKGYQSGCLLFMFMRFMRL